MILTAMQAQGALMAGIHAVAFPAEPWDGPSFATLLGQPGVFGFIDDRGGILLLRVAADEAEILTIGVTKRRLGIGRALLDAGLTKARALGAASMFLEVAADNAAGIKFYAQAGFVEVGRRKAYYADGQDALVLRMTW
jgi:ribosomal-protein-alanine N-acetyltransferase